MHVLRIESRSIDGIAEAVDLDQTAAEIVALSFTDTDLAMLATAWEARKDTLPGLRLANLAVLRHPYSIDLYLEKVVSKARFVLIRLLGGKDYWRYGIDEIANLAREKGIRLAIVPGDHRNDERLDDASTLDIAALRRIHACFAAGGIDNIAACLGFIVGHLAVRAPSPLPSAPPPVPPFHVFAPAARPVPKGTPKGTPRATIVFYRTWMLADDTAPVEALADALAARGFQVASVAVTSLKDPDAIGSLGDLLDVEPPDVILNLTAFSARLDNGGSVLDRANTPVLQLALSGGDRNQWAASQRGLGPADLAMNVVLPELDGRIAAGAISFKGETRRNDALEYTRLVHVPDPDAISHAADLARAWAELRKTPRADRRIACVLSDYPAKAGRAGYAVGLDTPRSVAAIAQRLTREGFDTGVDLDETVLISALTGGPASAVLTVSEYQRHFAALPAAFAKEVEAAWGEPGQDGAMRDGAFHFRIVRTGKLLVAIQPDRGAAASRKPDYHNPLLPPRHAYIAFYLWLRETERVHAIVHCGTHGTLEWLPGKASALSPDCAPRAVLGPVPLIYPFIVNNPGEAAQAKRRASAVTIGHLTPPLTIAGTHGVTAELEGLFDEYAEAQSLDPARAARLAETIVARARESGLAAESGVAPEIGTMEALIELDAWLCDLKDMRIGDGLHVFGVAPEAGRRRETAMTLASLSGTDRAAGIEQALDACGEAEMRGLLAALDGSFVPPGPAGAPARGRTDVLPTGRNLFGIDPRAVPTRTAWDIGRRTAAEMLTRHVQDLGEWPKRVVLDLWGSATMRTGGDDLAQAFALLGARPTWDTGSNRVSGFDILPLAILDRPRVDVTMRVSGLFRDVFPEQIALFDRAVREIGALDESRDDNPLAASVRENGPDTGSRVFGTGPGQYGTGLSAPLNAGTWTDRAELGEAYLAATSHTYGAGDDGTAAGPAFRARVAAADAFVHTQDMAEQDILGADAFAEHEGGFAAAALSLGNRPAMYHADTSSPGTPKIRTMREEIARVVRGRATNPRWIAGQMRHGFRGAAEIAETVDNLFAYAALTGAVDDRHFDLLYDATLGHEAVRAFLIAANPAAARGMADKFGEALRRGLWSSRRNSIASVLDGAPE